MYKLTIGENEAGQRLDRFLRKYLKRAPLSGIYLIIRKDLKVNGRRGKEDQMLNAGDELVFYIPEEEIADLAKATASGTAKRQFKVAYEDENVLIVNKPAGLLTHGDSNEKSNTLTNQVCGYLQQKGEYDPAKERTFRPSPVNRLDGNTSGLLIFGKSAEALRQFTAALRARGLVRKFYRTIVCGRLEEEMLIDESLVKDQVRNMVSVAGRGDKAEAGREGSAGGKESVSRVIPVRPGDDFSVIEVELLTGRTHQIRVHMAHAGHPLAGDPKYGDPGINKELKKAGIRTQLLHACRLEFAGVIAAGDCGEESRGEASEMDILRALDGKVIEADPPRAFAEAERRLAGG